MLKCVFRKCIYITPWDPTGPGIWHVTIPLTLNKETNPVKNLISPWFFREEIFVIRTNDDWRLILNSLSSWKLHNSTNNLRTHSKGRTPFLTSAIQIKMKSLEQGQLSRFEYFLHTKTIGWVFMLFMLNNSSFSF